MKILAKATAILVPMAFPCVVGSFFLLNWKEFSAKISLSALCSSRIGIRFVSVECMLGFETTATMRLRITPLAHITHDH